LRFSQVGLNLSAALRSQLSAIGSQLKAIHGILRTA
jgi:hypothetical protein